MKNFTSFRDLRAPGDANAIAALHADSWQRHYRGAFSDAFLDNDVAGYLLPLWTERLARPDPRARTILAETGGAFCAAWGGACVERAETPPPGGDPARLNGKPMELRYAWRDPSKLL